MELLYFLQEHRLPLLDKLLALLTRGGEVGAFLVIALTLYWCIDKRKAYYVMLVGFLGTTLNQFLKITCRIPRPWVKDPNFPIVESARAAATGYSFPSGHTQMSVGLYGCLARGAKTGWFRWGCLALCVLIPFSRIYLGVHFPSDVLFSAVQSVILVILLDQLLQQGPPDKLFLLLAALSAAFVLYVSFWPFPADVDAVNLAEAVKNAWTMLGTVAGLLLAYQGDKKQPFDTRAPLPVQILKVVLGLVLTIGIRVALKAPLNTLLSGHHAADGIRYFAMVAFAGGLWPRCFPALIKIMGRDR